MITIELPEGFADLNPEGQQAIYIKALSAHFSNEMMNATYSLYTATGACPFCLARRVLIRMLGACIAGHDPTPENIATVVRQLKEQIACDCADLKSLEEENEKAEALATAVPPTSTRQ